MTTFEVTGLDVEQRGNGCENEACRDEYRWNAVAFIQFKIDGFTTPPIYICGQCLAALREGASA